MSATRLSDVGRGPGAANVLFSRGRWEVARNERSGIAPFRRDPHSVSGERAGSETIRHGSAEGTWNGASRCNSIAFGILT